MTAIPKTRFSGRSPLEDGGNGAVRLPGSLGVGLDLQLHQAAAVRDRSAELAAAAGAMRYLAGSRWARRSAQRPCNPSL
jgi:hypothetical protein